ncbi:MAG: tRNA lysidine(34) synthetase TilS [Candidatus Omnitrophota bacterium]
MIIKKIKSAIERNKLLDRGEPVLVCVSGGPDSVFLLYVLAKINHEYKLKISVAHLNHCLRGSESDADEAFVAKLALSLGLPFFRARVEVSKLAKSKKMSIEQAARFARYNFFTNLCKAQKIKKIVLAHTKDDQVETILMRMLRGTGIKGLGGMKLLTEFEDILLVRPLLNIEKRQMLAYLKKNKIKSHMDLSNLEKNYFRNKVRLDIIPLLEKISPALKDNIARIGENARQTESFLQAKLKTVYPRIVSVKKPGEFCLDRAKFLKLMPIIRSGLIRKVIFALNGDINGIDYKHINLADSFIEQSISQAQSLDLPKSVQINKTRHWIKFLKKRKNEAAIAEKKKFFLKLGQELRIKSLGYWFKAVRARQNVRVKKHIKGVEYLDFDKLEFPLIVRAKIAGDSFKPLGSSGKKTVKKFLIDQKIDKQEKRKIPLVLSKNKIILVGDIRIADEYKVSNQTKNILKLIIKKLN